MTVWDMKTKFNKETEILKKMQAEMKMESITQREDKPYRQSALSR